MEANVSLLFCWEFITDPTVLYVLFYFNVTNVILLNSKNSIKSFLLLFFLIQAPRVYSHKRLDDDLKLLCKSIRLVAYALNMSSLHLEKLEKYQCTGPVT